MHPSAKQCSWEPELSNVVASSNGKFAIVSELIGQYSAVSERVSNSDRIREDINNVSSESNFIMGYYIKSSGTMKLDKAPNNGYITISHYISANSQSVQYKIGSSTSTKFYLGDELVDVDLSSSYFIFPGAFAHSYVNSLPTLDSIQFWCGANTATIKNVDVRVYILYIQMDEI